MGAAGTVAVTGRRRDLLTAATCAVGWGTLGPLVRWTALPPLVVATGRCMIGAAALWSWRARAGRSRRQGRSAWTSVLRSRPGRAAVIASGLALAAHWTLLFVALDRAPVGAVLVLVYLAPVLVALGAPLVGERANSATWLALGMAVAGTVLVAGPRVEGLSAAGVITAVASAAAYAVVVLIDKRIVAEVGGAELAALKLTVAGAALLPVMALVRPAATWPTQAVVGLAIVGVVHTALGLAVILDVLERLPATTAVVLLYLEPAAAVLFGWLLLGERPTPWTLLGGALIAAGGVVVGRVAPGEPPPG